MKTLLLAGLLLAASPAFAQKTAPPPLAGQESAAPFKGASVVVIHAPDSATVAYTKLGKMLLASGYTLDKTDERLGYINTTPRPISSGRLQMVLRFTILPAAQGATIQLQGVSWITTHQYRPQNIEGPISFRGMKGSPALAAWQEMQRVGALYAGGQLTYK